MKKLKFYLIILLITSLAFNQDQSFDKSIKDLTYTEAALLAALPKAPSKYNPYKNITLAKFRRNLVLNNLFENGFIEKNQYFKLKD